MNISIIKIARRAAFAVAAIAAGPLFAQAESGTTTSPAKIYASVGGAVSFTVNYTGAETSQTDLLVTQTANTSSPVLTVFRGAGNCVSPTTPPGYVPPTPANALYALWEPTGSFPANCGAAAASTPMATFTGTVASFPGAGSYVIEVLNNAAGGSTNVTTNDVTVCQKRTVSSVTASPATEGAVITYTVNFDAAVAVGCGGFAVPGVLSGTATAAPDLVVLLGTGTCANVADSATSCTILAQGADDTAVDGTKVATLTITDSTAASNYVSVGKTASANVLDNESSIAVALGRNGAEGGNSVQFVVTCNGPGTNVTVNYAWSGTATAADFTAALPTSTSFATCNGATQTVDLALVDDTLVEGTENVTLTISTPTANVAVVVGQSAATATISDNDSDPVFGLVTIAACAEPSTGCAFALNRLSGVTSARTLTFAVTGTATRGTDYDLKSGTDCATGTVIPVATNSVVHNSAGGQTLNVCPIDDLLPEVGGETVILTLTTAGSVANALYTLDAATTSRTQTIADDDSPQVVTVTGGGALAEAAGTGTFTYTRSGGSAAAQALALTVNIGRSGTATYGAACTAGVDYMSSVTGTTVTITGGQSTVDVTVTACDDALIDPAETVIYAVAAPAAPTDYTVGSPASATVTITDDDVAVNAVSGATGSALSTSTAEGTIVRFSVSCPTLATAQSIDFSITPATAYAGDVYSGSPTGSVTCPAAAASLVAVPTTVQTINDTTIGNARTYTMTISIPQVMIGAANNGLKAGAAVAATIIGNAIAVVNVTDDDQPQIVPTMSMFGLGFMSLMLAGFVAFQRRRVQK